MPCGSIFGEIFTLISFTFLHYDQRLVSRENSLCGTEPALFIFKSTLATTRMYYGPYRTEERRNSIQLRLTCASWCYIVRSHFPFLYEKFSIGVRVSYMFSLFSNIQRVWAKYAQTLKLLTLITSAFLLGVKVIRMYNTARQGKKITIFFSSHCVCNEHCLFHLGKVHFFFSLHLL